jgi:hypothetical protein
LQGKTKFVNIASGHSPKKKNSGDKAKQAYIAGEIVHLPKKLLLRLKILLL